MIVLSLLSCFLILALSLYVYENRRLRKMLAERPIFLPSDHWAHDVLAEMQRARSKFPDPDLLLSAFSEESGEVVKAVLDHYAGKGPLQDVRKELIQAAAMAGRLLEEGDPIHALPPSVWEK